MDTQIDVELLDRYLAGTCSPRERGDVERWIRQDPSRSLHALKASFSASPSLVGDADATLHRIRERLHLGTSVVPTRNGQGLIASGQQRGSVSSWFRTSGQTLGRLPYTLIGAVALITIGVTLYLAQDELRQGTLRQPSPVREFTTTTGQRMTLQLPDGSTMLLAPETRVRYATSFGKSDRTIEITGQALFTVTHAPGVPFIVRTASTDTKVLGTSFAVRQYATDSVAHIVVAEGKVAVNDRISPDAMIVTTGQEVRGTHLRDFTLQHIASMASALAWTQGLLEYTDTPAATVVTDLKRMYAFDLQISSPELSTQRVTGVFEQTMSPEGAVRLLALILGGEIEKRGTTFYITER